MTVPDPAHSAAGPSESHVCCLYSSEAERRDVLTRFVLEGVRRGEKVVGALADGDEARLEGDLVRAGEDPAALVAAGRLTLIPARDVYRSEDPFDAERGLSTVEGFLSEALGEGFKGVRTVGDLRWLRDAPDSREAFFRYEAAVNRLIEEHGASSLCMYRKDDLSVGDQFQCLSVHPVALIGDEILRNPHFETPAEILEQDPIEASLRWRRRAVEGLEEATRTRRLLETILASVEAAVLIVDRGGRKVTECNPAAEAMFGYSREELVGMPTRALHVDEPHWREFGNVSCHVLDEGEVYRGDFRMRRADGSVFPSRHVVNPLDPALGAGGGVVSTIRDMSTEVEARRRESETSARFRAIARSISDAVLTIDADSRIVYANPAAHQMIGVGEGELAGRSMTEIMPEAQRERHREGMHRYLETGERRLDWSRVEMPVLRADGSTFDAEISFGEYRAEGNRYLTGVIRDTTERRRLEAELRQSQKMEAVGRLASGVAHDFNNLLTLIRAHADMIREDLPEHSPASEDVSGVLEAVERASAMTGQLLSFSRAQVLTERVLDLPRLVVEMTPLLRRAIPSRIELSLEASDAALHVRGDANEIHRAFLNLVLNAVDAIDGRGSIRIGVSAESCSAAEVEAWSHGGSCEPGRYARVVVEDTGSGIESELLDRIFDPFFTSKGEGRGTGLGLSSVLGIVRQMGGHVEVDSEPGQGTRFVLHLPETRAEEEEPRGPDVRPTAPAAESEPDRTVLVVEDDEALAAVLARALRRQGYHVLSARDGNEALEIARDTDEPIDVTLSDVVMPGVTGPELLASLRETHPEVRLVLMSGHTPSEIAGRIPPDADAFLSKPFSPQELTDVVRSVLSGKGDA